MRHLHCPASAAFVLILAVACALAGSSAGCGQSSPWPLGVSSNGSVISSTRNRTFLINIAASYTPSSARPVVILFHGGLGTGANAESAYNFNPVGQANNLILLYPDGFGKSWNAGNCCGQAVSNNIDDVQFMRDLLDLVESRLCVDTDRYLSRCRMLLGAL